MALFRRLFYRKPPDRLLEIAERVYVFDCCFSTETLGEGEYKDYMGGIIAQLQDYYADASLMVCNFRERDKRSQISDMLSPYDVMVMDYPLQSEGCPLLPLVMIHHFLKSSESWLSMEGLHNVLLMHCERGCWPVLAFMLASLLLYRKQYTGEQKTLEMAYKQAPKELLHLLSPLNPQASHLRYLQYISRRGIGSDWPPQDTPFTLESLMLWAIPRFDGESGCRPMVRIYRQDHLTPTSPKILFATPRAQKHIHHYSQAKAVTIKINARCHVQGDVVIECLHMDKDLEHEEMMFRVMFNTAFVQSKILALTRDEIDIVWSAKDQFPRDFKIEVVFSDSDAFKSETSTEPIAEEGDETEYAFTEAAEEFFEVEEVFSSADWHGTKRDPDTPATRDPERSPKGEAYSLTDKTRSGLEMSISEYDSKTMITQDFADVEKVGVNLETHKKVVAETLAGLDIVVPIEDKTIIESSTIPQGRNGNSNSIAEEKNASEISNFKLEKEVDKKVSVFMKSMAGMQKQELYNSTNNMGKMISRMRSTIIGDVPSSGTICHSRDTDRFIAEDKVQPQCEGSFGTSGITYPTMSRLPTSNAKDEKIDEMTVFLDYMGTCEEKNILEVSYGQHEVKDIVALDVEDKSTTKTYNIKHDADHLVTNKMITLPDIYCESEDPALTGKAESRLEQRECKLGPDIIVNRKKSTQTGKGHYPGTQDMQSAVKFKMEMRVRKDDIGKGVAQIKIDPKAVRQKALNDEQVQTTEETLYTISKKTPTCIRPPGNDVSKPKIEQQECVGDPKVSAKPKKVFRWISQKESSDTTSAISACYNIDNVAEDTVSSASVSGTSTSLQLPSQSSLLPLPPSIEELHHVVPLMALHCENLFFLPSQLQACLPPPSPPLPPPKSAKVAILASPSYTTTKMPTSPPLPTSHYPLGNASSTSPPPPPSRLSSVRASADGLSPPLSPRPAAIVPVMFVKGSPPQPMLSGESTKGPPSPDSHVSSEASVKNAAPPPPPPPLYPRSTMKGPLMAQSLSPSLIKNLSSIPPPPPLLPNQGGRTQGPPSPPPPLLSNQGGRTHCLPPPPPPQLPNQGGRILGPPPPPPPPLRPNINISVSHPQCSAISGKCSSVLPPVPPPVPPLKSSSNATELPGGSAPIPQCLPPPEHGGNQPSRPALVAHGGTPPPPPPPRARTPNRRGSPRVRRSPSPSLSARPASQVDDRGLSPRRRVTFPTASSSLAPRKPSLKPLHWVKVTRAVQGSLWAELQKSDDAPCASEFDVSELESLFSAMVPKKDGSSKTEGRCKSLGSKPDKVYLIDLRRANNTEIMLTKVKMPLSDMMSAALAMDDSLLDVDQVDNLIKFCPTKEEMELLKGYTGDKQKLGKCEQYFLELMKVPRVESKLRVFSFKIQFGSQVSYLRTSLNTINSICEQVRSSVKLKEIMKKILYLGNTLNQGTARGSAIGFRLDGLLKLTDTRAANNKMTLMHYLCKALAMKSPHLLDFHEEITSLEAASKIQLKYLAEEMQAIVKGLEKVELELQASEHDGPVSEVFRKTLKEFTAVAGAEVQSLSLFYTEVGRKADALGLYFGEDPAPCPFERVVSTLLNFVLMFRRAQQENCKQAELEKKKAEKKREMDKMPKKQS